ncbi:PTS glucose/sucrose transporter subunit IIB [Actinomadura namibiensis]|nr:MULTISPECIES: PTS glucose/sucrose transporter subunit IIB [Actinomadura]
MTDPADPATPPQGEAMDKAEAIVAALGGADNITEIEPCATRLRTEVEDAGLVDEAALKAAGAFGVMRAGNVVQVVVGPEADTIASDIEDILD